MNVPLVIGLGNRWRGDDALGPLVLDALRKRNTSNPTPHFEWLESPADTLTLINAWSQHPSVYLIDACYHNSLSPGSLITVNNAQDRSDVLHSLRSFSSSHLLDLAQAMGLSSRLGKLPQKVVIYSAVGEQFELGTEPSKAILHAVKEIANRLTSDIARPDHRCGNWYQSGLRSHR